MGNDKLLHDMMVDFLHKRLARDYKEITINSQGGPDMILANHGLTMAHVEVETEESITPEKADEWKELAGKGTKLILMIPKNSRVKVMETLWQKGIADKVGVGTYEITINMP
jgi:hypothetical protein